MSWSPHDDDSIVGSAICDICEPWIEHSRQRANRLPFWAQELVHSDPTLLEQTRVALENIVELNLNAQWGPRGLNGAPIGRIHNHLGPHNDWAWLDFIEWCVGPGHPDIIRGFNHAEAREGDDWLSEEIDTVPGIRDWIGHIRGDMERLDGSFHFESDAGFIYAEKYSLGDHEIVIHSDSLIIDGVSFGDDTDGWMLDPEIVPDLLFDSIHGLDSRPIDLRAELYSLDTRCLHFIDHTRNILAPDIPYIRELMNNLAEGEFGTDALRRFHAALVLWSSHPEREFHTCSRDAWATSFGLVREISNEMPSHVRIEPQGIFVDGVSGNKYRISPPQPTTSTIYDGFEVRTASRSTDNLSKPICIHTSAISSHLPMGDIVASLILMLREDIESAKSIGPLQAHLPAEFSTRARVEE